MTVVFDQTTLLSGTDDGNGNSNFNARQLIRSAALSSATGTQMRVTVLWGTAETSEVGALDDLWVGQAAAAGQPEDFNGNQVKILFSGSGSLDGSAAGLVTSDWVTLGEAYDNTKNYVFAQHFKNGSNSNISFATFANGEQHGDSGGASTASQTSPSMTFTNTTTLAFIAKIEVQAVAAANTPYTRLQLDWPVVPTTIITGAHLVPPISGPTPQNPPLRGQGLNEVLINWLPKPPDQVFYPKLVFTTIPAAYIPPSRFPTLWPVIPYDFIVARNLTPPSGPIPQNPPVNGTKVPVEVQISWLPRPPDPIVAINLDPPIAGPTPQNPPIRGTRVSSEILTSWLPKPYDAIVAINLDPPIAGPTPQNPPIIGTVVPYPVQISWIPKPYDRPQVSPYLVQSFIQGYPFTGTYIPIPVQISWLPKPYDAIIARNLASPISGPTPQNPPVIVPHNTEIMGWWTPKFPDQVIIQYVTPSGPVSVDVIVHNLPFLATVGMLKSF